MQAMKSLFNNSKLSITNSNNIARKAHRLFSTSKGPSIFPEFEASEGLTIPIIIKNYNKSNVQSTKESKSLNNFSDSARTASNGTSVSQGSWFLEGKKSGLLSKGPELYWSDLQETRQELSWYLTEQCKLRDNKTSDTTGTQWRTSSTSTSNNNSNPMQWYNDWQATYTKQPSISSQKAQFEILHNNESKSNNQTYSPSDVSINTAQTDNNSNVSNTANHRQLFINLAKRLGVRTYEDWYYINILDVKDAEIRSLLMTHYDNSLIRALISVYPEFDWKIYKFETSFKGILNNEINRDAMDKEIEELNGNPKCEDPNTTYNKYKDHWQVRLFNAKPLPSYILNQQPQHPSIHNTRSNQQQLVIPTPEKDLLFDYIKKMFPDIEVSKNFTYQKFEYSDTKRPFNITVYIPSLKLGFDYFEDPNTSCQYAVGANYSVNLFNRSKKNVCDKLGITLIEVPSWWDRKSESLLVAIRRCRPDVFKK